MIVPFPAGGPSDIVARIAAEGMSRHLGQNIVIENVGGAGGTIGATRAAEAEAGRLYGLRGQHGHDYRRADFLSEPEIRLDQGLRADRHVGQCAGGDLHQEGYSGEKPQGIRRLGEAERRQCEAGAWRRRRHLAHGVPAVQQGLRSQADAGRLSRHGPRHERPDGRAYRLTCASRPSSWWRPSRAKRSRAWWSPANERLAAIPNVPSAKEAGAPDFQLNIWSAIYAPKGTPKDIVAKLADALDKTLDEPATAKKLGKLGGTVPPKAERGPDHLRKTVASDIPRWAPILKEAAAATTSN